MELIIDRVSKQYRNNIAVDRISVKMQRGVYGLLGVNGAGKTTLMRMMCIPFMGSYYAEGELVDTHLNMYQTDKRYSEGLDGRAINQELLEETIAAYRKIPYTKELHYTLTEEYQQYARPYSAIFNFIVGTTNMQTSEVILSWQPNEDDLYTKRQVWLQSMWEDFRLSKSEIEFWQESEAQIKMPFVYQHHEAYSILISC